MKPIIGRIVHLNVNGFRIPAIVTYLNEAGEPGLHALDGSGVNVHHAKYAEESAESAAQPNTMDTPHYSWSWPPRA